MKMRRRAQVVVIALLFALFSQAPRDLRAQQGQEVNPAAALTAALVAACRQNDTEFANYLTADSAESFRALTAEQRKVFLSRLALLDGPGRPLVSSDAQNHTVLRCEDPSATVEFRFGTERVRENLAFIPVQVVDGRSTRFGLVREGGGWRLISLGLLLFDIPELQKQWAEEDLAAREAAVIKTLRALTDAIGAYRNAWEKLPDSLAQLGPPAKEGVSADAADLVDADMAAGRHSGYLYRYRVVPAADGADAGFELSATPQQYGKTGRRSFLLDSAGKLHAADHQSAGATRDDPVISSE
jgi:hypothetical protein